MGPKTKKCEWCGKRKSTTRMYFLGNLKAAKGKPVWICDDCNYIHDVC